MVVKCQKPIALALNNCPIKVTLFSLLAVRKM